MKEKVFRHGLTRRFPGSSPESFRGSSFLSECYVPERNSSRYCERLPFIIAAMSLEEAHPVNPTECYETIPAFAVESVDAGLKEDLRLLWCSQPNVLLVGAHTATALLPYLLPTCRQPVHQLSGAAGKPWPDAGTLLFHNIGALDKGEQQVLHDWLERFSSRIQVISLARAPISSLVASGGVLGGPLLSVERDHSEH